MSTASTEKIQSRIGRLNDIIERKTTPEGEREAAKYALNALRLKLEALNLTAFAGEDWDRYKREYGSKYTGYMAMTELNKILRTRIKDIRAIGKKLCTPGAGLVLHGTDLTDAIAEMPDFIKTSVSKGRGTQSIYITLKGVPADWWEDATDDRYGYVQHYRKPGERLQAIVDALLDLMWEYNYDGSNIAEDYFDRNFYEHVQAVDAGDPTSTYPRDLRRSRR